VIRFVLLSGTYSADEELYDVRENGEHIGYFFGDEKHARALETAVMIIERTPLALDNHGVDRIRNSRWET
jgi:hypothetical protein